MVGELGRKIVAPGNRGIVLDLVVFVVNVLLVRALVSHARSVAHSAQDDVLAKGTIALFFAGLLLLQPIGPALKRWSFHQRSSFAADTSAPESTAGCLVFWFMPVYLVLMFALATAAAIMLGDVLDASRGGAAFSMFVLLGGLVWSVCSVVVIYRYFMKPARRPHWTFLTTPQAAHLGDACMYVNVIALQIVWGSVTASQSFREIVTGTPLGRPGSFTDIVGRLFAAGVLAALVYFPGRIFYLVEDKHRGLTWATMLLANLPLSLSIALAPPFRSPG